MKVIASWARVSDGASGVARWIGMAPIRLRAAWRDLRDAAPTAPGGPTPAERREDLIAFYQRYEALVETLCDGAQYGPDSTLEDRYQLSRLEVQRHYPTVRAFVRPYLGDAEEGAAVGREQKLDSFESLFAPPTLAQFLRSDDGLMIERIMRTRQALTLYGEHLRQLEAASRS